MTHRKVSLWFVILTALSLPALASEASGEFTAGKRPPIKPLYAAAYETRDQRDARKRAIEVVLSEEPIDAVAAAAALDPHTDAINQKALMEHNYVLLWVRPGNDVSMNATYSATMTQFIEGTPDRMKAEMTVNTPDRVAGRVFSTKPLETMDGEPYSINLTFSAAVTHPPAGTKLQAGGGEPGKAFNALQEAMTNRDWDGIKSHVTPKRLESFNDSERSVKDNLDDALQTLGMFLPKKAGKITGGELRGDTAVLDLEAELFEGQYGLFQIRMVNAGKRWLFDRATRAGLIGN